MFPTRGIDLHCLLIKGQCRAPTPRLSSSGSIVLALSFPASLLTPGFQAPQSPPSTHTPHIFSRQALCIQFLSSRFFFLECVPATVMSICRAKCLYAPHLCIGRAPQGAASHHLPRRRKGGGTPPGLLPTFHSSFRREEGN